jgi:hypothetical protein
MKAIFRVFELTLRVLWTRALSFAKESVTPILWSLRDLQSQTWQDLFPLFPQKEREQKGEFTVSIFVLTAHACKAQPLMKIGPMFIQDARRQTLFSY